MGQAIKEYGWRDILRKSEIIKKIEGGWILTNRGTGWFLQAKYIAYKRQKSIKISEEVVDDMEKDGILKINIPYTSAQATLILKGNS